MIDLAQDYIADKKQNSDLDIKLEKPKTKLEENMGEYVIWGNNNPE